MAVRRSAARVGADGAAVALVTRGGEFDEAAGASSDNTVVFAAPAG